MPGQVQITEAGLDRVSELRDLWAAMYEHHSTLQAQVAPVRTLEDSWRRRRAQYEEWLADGEMRLFLAERDGGAVGYAVMSVGPGPPTWDVGERVAEIESLSVLASERGAGIGAMLIAAVRAAARAEGVESVAVGVAHANSRALDFYRREGFAPFYELLLSSPPGTDR